MRVELVAGAAAGLHVHRNRLRRFSAPPGLSNCFETGAPQFISCTSRVTAPPDAPNHRLAARTAQRCRRRAHRPASPTAREARRRQAPFTSATKPIDRSVRATTVSSDKLRARAARGCVVIFRSPPARLALVEALVPLPAVSRPSDALPIAGRRFAHSFATAHVNPLPSCA